MKPILFSTSMVQAILDGRKTQTRRVVNPQPDRFFEVCDTPGNYHLYDVEWGLGRIYPKYQVGDILWVRETWSKDENGEYVYRANYGTTEDDSFPPSMFKWRPSIHMPREAARIFLRVTNVRVERVQDITAHDAIREGMESEIPFDTVDEFKELWNNLNAKRGYGWDTNPWVWVVKFERISKEETLLKESEVEEG
jgi:hypothetical protein